MGKRRSHIRNGFEAAAIATAHALFRAVPTTIAEGIGSMAFRLYRLLDSRRRRLAERNLKLAFPEKSRREISALSRRVFAHFGAVAADLLRSYNEPLERTLSRVDVVHGEIARAAVASGRGVVFLASHFGNWELAAVAVATHGLPMAVVARPLDNPILEKHLRTFRERSGNVVIAKSEAARPILRTLRTGGTVAVLADQHAHPPDAVVVPFFGRPASTTTSVARFVDKTEALILPASAEKIGPGRYRLVIEAPLDVRALSDAERALLPLTARLNRILERKIRECPHQWLWFHNRWRMD